jgi:tetratricopeptide (TPR) repeat protein
VAREPHSAVDKPEPPVNTDVSFGFALNFISGRGLLSLKDKPLGPLEVKVLELEIPEISFPFDVSGGADRFKNRRCALRHLTYSLDADGLAAALKRNDLKTVGFHEIRAAIRDGFIELTGRFAVGEHQADFTMRAALLVRSPEELSVVFFDTRLYGWLPVPSGLLPEYLRRGLDLPFIASGRAGAWTVRPIEQFLREVLPRGGWKIPDTRGAALVAAEATRGQIVIVGGPEGEPSLKQLAERAPPAAAVRAGEGVASFVKAEEALSRGNIQLAYQYFREAVDDERGGRWARERLLQLGAADPELAMETRQLAEDTLAQEPQNIQALLALAAIALRERSWGEAANRYAALADGSRSRKERFDALAADLAAAEAAKPIDPVRALAAYERAAARARDSVSAHRALLELKGGQGDWRGAALAGERLARLENEPTRRAEIHSELGHIYRAQLGDLKRARLHFERALRLAPDDPSALEGLAETYAARGEPARAASYLSRLAEQAEEAGETKRIVTLNLRLGEIWERWLADVESATARYMRVLDVDPKNRPARLRLAKLAEDKGDIARARTLYEDILAAEEERSDPEAVPDLVAAYTRLARVTFKADGATPEAIACLERAVELDPTNRAARDELARILKERGEWGRLLHLFDEAIRVSTSPEDVRRARLDAADIELTQRKDLGAAERYLLQILDEHPDDPEALAILLPMIEADGDWVELIDRLTAAAEATSEPERRASSLFQLASAHENLGFDSDARRRDLEGALDANPYLLPAAAALVALAESQKDPAGVSLALERLAIAEPTAAERGAVLVRRGNILWQELNRAAEAEAVFAEATRADPANVDGWLSLATAVTTRHGDARAILDQALQGQHLSGTRAGSIHRRLAEVAREAEDNVGEAQHLTAAMATGLVDDDLADRLVTVLTTQGERRRAAELLEGWALPQTGEIADRLSLRAAEVRRSLGEMEQATAALRTILARRGSLQAQAADLLERIATELDDAKILAEALSFKVAAATARELPALLERLVSAQMAAGDLAHAEDTCGRMIALDPFAAVALRTMATLLEQRNDWSGTLKHYWTLLLEAPHAGQDRQERRQTFERAAALVREVEPTRLDTLQRGFDEEFPDAPPGALSKTFGELLAAEGKWEQLLSLRRGQIESGVGAPTIAYRREVAEILHRRLGQSDKAISYYQDVVVAQADDVAAREALLEIFTALGRWKDLAAQLAVMSQLMTQPVEALDYGLQSVDVYVDKLGDVAAAGQVLRALAGVVGTSGNGRYPAALRKLGLTAELADYLERAVAASPDPEDPKFIELTALLSGPLKDPKRAVEWCQRMSEAYAAAERPRRIQVDLLKAHPKLGGADVALRKWAEETTGKPRSKVLIELADLFRANGDERQALAVLNEAAQADPTAESLLTQLIDRYTARGEWEQVRHWLEQLAFGCEPGAMREQRLRRLAEVATDYAESPEIAAGALRALEGRTEAETRHLAQLFAQLGNIDGLSELGAVFDVLDRDTILQVAKSLVGKGRLDEARRYLEAAMDKGGAVEAWEIASDGWRAADRLKDLGEWRFARAAKAVGEDRVSLQLLGRAELLEAGEVAPGGDAELLAELGAADLDKPMSAWAVLNVALSIDNAEFVDRAARALEPKLKDNDPRLARVLRVRLEHELAVGQIPTALALARRLNVRADASDEAMIEKVLTAAGETDELLELIVRRATRGQADASGLWVRAAELQLAKGAASDAAASLVRCAAAGRDLHWAELALELSVKTGDVKLEADACDRLVALTTGSTVRAGWMRRRARILWLRLEQAEAAKELLFEAQMLRPLAPETVLQEVDGLVAANDVSQAQHVIDEALAVLEGQATAALWVRRAELAADHADEAGAGEALTHAQEAIGDDGGLWHRIGLVAQRLEDTELKTTAYTRAYSFDHQFEESYVGVLEATAQWEKLVEVLAARASELTGEAAGERLVRGATIARARMGNDARALDLLESAARAAPSLENLRSTFQLAAELDRGPLVAALGPALLKRLPADDGDRIPVLHRLVTALEHLSLEQDAVPALTELRQRRANTIDETLLLARLRAADDPQGTAELLEEAAEASEGAPRVERLLAAVHGWLTAKQPDRARPLLTLAMAAGADTVDAHRLVIELMPGPARLSSIERLIALEGDRELEPTTRARLRFDLAQGKLADGDAKAAYELLLNLVRFAKPDGWTAAVELALKAQGLQRELAALWLEEGARAWQGKELLERTRQAATIFAGLNDVLGELKALQALARLEPDDAQIQARLVEVAAALGTEEQLTAHVEEELRHAVSAEARGDVALRYAPILEDRFDNPAAAASLLRRAHQESPSEALAEALAESLVAAGTPAEGVTVLVAQGGRLEGAQRVRLLLNAAALAAGAAGDAATAYGIYAGLFAADPTLAEAREFCLGYCLKGEQWQAAMKVLESSAAATRDPGIAYAQLVRAADLARDRLQDAAAEIRLLEVAVGTAPGEPHGVTRLLERLLAKHDWDGALGLILGGHVLKDRELALGEALLKALRAEGRGPDVEHLLEFLASRHPESALGAEARLKRARAAGDNQALLLELQARLPEIQGADAATRYPLLAEAGRAALMIGDKEQALQYLAEAVAAPNAEVDLLLVAAELADLANDVERLDAIVQCAAARRVDIAKRAGAAGDDTRNSWMFLLGRARERSLEIDDAIVAYEAVAAGATNSVVDGVFSGLARLYEKKGDWQRLVLLLNRRVASVQDPAARADIYHRMGVIWQHRLVDEERAGDCFSLALKADPEHEPSQLAHGLLLYARNQFDLALPLLRKRVNPEDPQTPMPHLIAYADCLRETRGYATALDVIAEILRREPRRVELVATRAEMMESLDRGDEAVEEWKVYLRVLGSKAAPSQVAQVRKRLAALARARKDIDGAVRELEEAHKAQADDLEIVRDLRQLYETQQRWSDAVDLRICEAAATEDAEARTTQYKNIAAVLLTRLNDPTRATTMLERAVEGSPNDIPLLRQVLALHEECDDWRKYLIVGERLMSLTREEGLEPIFFVKMARAYFEAVDDTERAKEFYAKAMAKAPDNVDITADFAAFAKTQGDFATYVEIEEKSIGLGTDIDEKIGRYQELAEVCLHELKDLQKAAAALFKALDLRPNDPEVTRALANTYALDPRFYAQAADLYRKLSELDPLDAQTLRILARLHGQMGENDRAYCYYAALLAVTPSDDEAKRFVAACRPAVPPGPQRALADADRVQGLIHPDQAGPIEELFAPLARFAELTRPGNLATLGVTERDLIAPTDPRLVWMKRVLDPLGVSQVTFYVRRGGGFTCQTELVGTAAIVIGSTLATDATDRQRTFLVARAAELYRTGHTLADQLTPPEISALVGAICLAIKPDASPPGCSDETPLWANTIAAPMTEAIRSSLVSKAQAYLDAAAKLDFIRWRWGALATAGRVALLLSCDVEDGVNALLRLRGVDDVSDDQRPSVIRELPEAMDLLRFGTSEPFFRLRQSLGLALRRSK